MKVKIRRVLALSSMLAVAFTTTAFAASVDMERGGRAYLNCGTSGELKSVSGGTIRGNVFDYASLSITTTYDDGSTSTYSSGMDDTDQTHSSGWEWALDYSSIHKLFTSSEDCYDTVRLSVN